MTEREELELQLENLADKFSLAEVVDSLVSVCFAKSEHIRTNWNDGPMSTNERLAKAWDRDGEFLGSHDYKAGS